MEAYYNNDAIRTTNTSLDCGTPSAYQRNSPYHRPDGLEQIQTLATSACGQANKHLHEVTFSDATDAATRIPFDQQRFPAPISPDSSWRDFDVSKRLELSFPPDHRWNQTENPTPPLAQIILRDYGNDLRVFDSLVDAMQLQAFGDKTQLGKLFIAEYTKRGGDAADAQQMVEGSLSTQKRMQLDIAHSQIAEMIVGEDANEKSFEELQKSNPNLAFAVDEMSLVLAQESPFKMKQTLDVMRMLYSAIDEKYKDSPQTAKERKNDRDAFLLLFYHTWQIMESPEGIRKELFSEAKQDL